MFGIFRISRRRERRASQQISAPVALVPAGRVDVGESRPLRVRAFELDVRPVTNADWEVFHQQTGARRPPWMYRPGFGDPDQPVVGVTYEEALDFARWQGKRLPSEYEWLRAVRGDDRRPYPWGQTLPNRSLAHFGAGEAGGPAPVGAGHRAAGRGPWGHRDLCGNIWEWCRGAVLRGGFWGSERIGAEVRMVERPDRSSGGIGFRCAR